jgi:transcriptional antiterminator RfaH
VSWGVARIHSEALATRCLAIAGFSVYLPRLRVHRMVSGRRVEFHPALFPNYCFVQIEAQWHSARWSAGVTAILMDGDKPARLPDGTIAEIKRRERGGLVELEQAGIRRGDRVRILKGPFAGYPAIFSNSRPRDRVEVLLMLLGSTRAVTLPALDVVK